VTKSYLDRLGLSADRVADKPATADTVANVEVRRIRLDKLEPDARNARKTISEESIAELAGSLRDHGLINPITVRAGKVPGTFELVAGERRRRAAMRAGWEDIPAIVQPERMSAEVSRARSIVENLQREDVPAVEQAEALRELLDAWDVSQAELARRLSVSTSYVSRMLALLSLDEKTREKVASGKVGARTALGSSKPKSGRRRRSSHRGAIRTPFGVVTLKRGAKLSDMVSHLGTLVDQEKRDAA
jgi:ParB family chromosome partitioning protein